MDIVESVKMAVTTLMANKLRSSLTMLGIIIGNASVISMIGIGEGAQHLSRDKLTLWVQTCYLLFPEVLKRKPAR